MVLREVGGLLTAFVGGGFGRAVLCESRKGKIPKDEDADKKKGNRVDEWGKDVQWVALDEAAKLAKTQFKPMMIIIQKKDCPKCDVLRSQVSLSDEFASASKDFVMVVIEQDQLDTVDETFRPDGDYVPRALFFHPDGPFLARFTNEFITSPKKYVYRSPKNLVRVMNKAKYHFLDI